MKKIKKMIIWPIQLLRKMYWWLFRPTTLGVKIIILNTNNQILLVKHAYQDGWALPGGGTGRESVFETVIRELKEEINLDIATKDISIFGVYKNNIEFKDDHVVVFIAKINQVPKVSSVEILSYSFFDLVNLPKETTTATKKCINEFIEGKQNTYNWR